MNLKDRIVFIDDDEGNSLLVEVWLTNAGISNVTYFRDPLIALENIKKGPQPIMVISDYNMPSMNGVDLLNEIKKVYPETKTLIVSATSQLQWHPQQPHPILVKGINYLDDLVRAIKKELTQPDALCGPAACLAG